MNIHSLIQKITPYSIQRQLMSIIAGMIFLEFCTMLVLDFLPPLPILINALIDCSILTLLLTPLVFLVIKKDTKYQNEQKRTTDELKENEMHLFTLANTGHALIWTSDSDRVFNYFNLPWLFFTGRPLEQELGNGWLKGIHQDDLQPFLSLYESSFKNQEKFSIEFRLLHSSGEHRWIQNDASPRYNINGECIGYIGHCLDISVRKQTEAYRETSRKILQILNEPGEINQLMEQVISILKHGTGIDAIGIRMQKGDDFPFLTQHGFDKDFLLHENSLLDRDEEGTICHDPNGVVCLACTCGAVISGRNEKSYPFSTPAGSCWTNESSQLLKLPPPQDIRFHPRNRCMHKGYASLALVPIRNKEKIVGLIQLNDYRKDRFTRIVIEKLEEIASHISGAIVRKHTEELLRKEDERRLSILKTAMDGFWLMDNDGRLLEVNDSYCRMSGFTEQELLTMNIGDLEAMKNKMDIINHWQKIKAFGEDRFETRHYRKDGTTFDIEVSIQYQSAEGGQFVAFLHDITQRKAREEALRKLNQTLLALSKSSQALSQSVDEADYLNQVCQILVEDTDFAMVWIGFAEEDKAKTILPVASAGMNDNYLQTIKLSWDDSETGRGPSGTAIRTGKPAICHDMLTDPEFKPWRKKALKQGFASSIVFPLKNGNKIFGAINIYSRKPESFLEVETNLLSELANDLAQGIMTLRLQAAHQLAEIALSKSHAELEVQVKERTRELQFTNELLKKEIDIVKQQEQSLKVAEEKYRTVANHTHGWEFWLDKDDHFIYCSPSCQRITGHKASEFLNNPGLLFEIIHPDDFQLFKNHKKTEDLHPHVHQELEYRIVRADGAVRWIGHECQPIYEASHFIGVRGSNRDITERKEMEQLLITSNRKYRLLSENITDGIFICRNGYFEYVNEAMKPIFGFEAKELIGKPIHQLIVPEFLEELNFLSSLKATVDQRRNIEIECVRKDQSKVLIEFLFNYVAKEGIIYGVVHDITEKRQLQKNIVKAIILTEEKEKAYFSKELHDGLGPLLSTIKLYLQWSEMNLVDQSREDIVKKAEEILEDAITTVKEISNKLSPHLLINHGLCSAIESFLDKLEETLPIQIVFNFNQSRRLGSEIEAAAYRAIIECVNNTIKYAQAKTITIDLIDTGSQLLIQYLDDGIGFDLHETLSVKKGLGLFNLQNRIQNIGGKIALFSEPGKGVNYQMIINL